MVNTAPETGLTAPEMLAIAYAPKVARPQIRWLLQFDQRQRQVLERAREPLIAQMRLAWWRDMLAKPAAEWPKGEPLFAELAELDDIEALKQAALRLVDATELRIDASPEDNLKSDRERALAIYHAFAQWVDGDLNAAEKLALAWAGQGDAIMTSAPRNLRPLSILALAAQLERGESKASGARLIWHALTGR
jgi:15-cis-phytoene synthase